MQSEDTHLEGQHESFYKTRSPSERARLKAQIKEMGPPPREAVEKVLEEMRQLREQKAKVEREQQAKVPKVFYHEIINLNAGRAKRTPAEHISRAWNREIIPETPVDIQDWYAKIYGDFAKPPLADLLDAVLRRGLKGDPKLIEGLDEAILKGNLKWLEELTCCVAVIHGMPYAGNGQSRHMASATMRNVQLTFNRLFGFKGQRPSASEIRVEMVRYACSVENDQEPPKFSDVWYLLRSGPKNDSDDEPGYSARYEVTGIKNIKKILKSLKLKTGPSLRGPLTAKKIKSILDKWGLGYVDDSEMVT